jgi:hypothetical protein
MSPNGPKASFWQTRRSAAAFSLAGGSEVSGASSKRPRLVRGSMLRPDRGDIDRTPPLGATGSDSRFDVLGQKFCVPCDT